MAIMNYGDLDGLERCDCSNCGKSRKYFCYDCVLPIHTIKGRIPQIKLPVNVHIVRHPKETVGKGTGVHCSIIAPSSTTVSSFPQLPQFSPNCVLLAPCEGALPLREVLQFNGNIDQLVFIDCTWNQLPGMIKYSELGNLQCVKLDETYKTTYWRPQKGKRDSDLATIEAIYYALNIYSQSNNLGIGESLKDLLYFYDYFRSKVDFNALKRKFSKH